MFYFFGHKACGILAPQPGIKPASSPLEGEVLTTGPPGKSPGGPYNVNPMGTQQDFCFKRPKVQPRGNACPERVASIIEAFDPHPSKLMRTREWSWRAAGAGAKYGAHRHTGEDVRGYARLHSSLIS